MSLPVPSCEIYSERKKVLTLSACPTFGEIRTGYRPGRSSMLSLIGHQILLLMIAFLSRHSNLIHLPHELTPPPPVIVKGTLYLPVLGGGSEGSGRQGGAAGSAGALPDGLRSKSRRGFAYPRPQAIISNPPDATVGIQTILQPALVHPPLFRKYIPLPDIVRPPTVAEASPAQPALKVKQDRLSLRPTPEVLVQAPKLALPSAAKSAASDLIAKYTSTSRPAARLAVPAAPEMNSVPVSQREQKGLLVLNAVPPPPDLHVKLPTAEARSLFAVVPGEATIIADPAVGAKTGGDPSSAAGSGSRSDLSKGDAVAQVAGGGKEAPRATGSSGAGSGGHVGSGQGTGLNSSGEGSATGRGAGSGSALGSGSAGTLASGAGSGSAPGKGSFPGISIQGGRYGNGGTTGVGASVVRSPRNYNMTIIATAGSGGGLPDLGVFANEKVYTVFLDMRANDEDPTPPWTLQYSVLASNADSADGATRSHEAPTPPYALLKEIPKFSPELVGRYARRLIIASAVMNAAGKLEQIVVRQSPDGEFSRPIVEALGDWMFQPAQVEGKSVALKVLLGIRISPSK